MALTVAIGSGNKVKVEATRLAFSRAFPGVDLSVKGFETESGVSDQPMGEDETFKGAMNRALGAVKAYTHANDGISPAYAVGLEGGCKVETFSFPSAASAQIQPKSELVCFAFMCVFQPSTGRWGYARTSSFSLPPEVAALVTSGVELGVADDRVFGRVDSKRSNGAIGLLTGDIITRTTYYEHALICALVPFLKANEPFFPDSGDCADPATANKV